MKTIFYTIVLTMLLFGCQRQVGIDVEKENFDNAIDTAIMDTRKALVLASREAGISIVTDCMATVSQAGLTFVSASIEGVDNIPPTAYKDGVDVGFAYYSNTKSDRIPTGFYTIRISADVEQLGEVESQIEFVARDGRVVARTHAIMNVFSLTVPENPPFVVNVINPRIQIQLDEKTKAGKLAFSFECPNGYEVPDHVFGE